MSDQPWLNAPPPTPPQWGAPFPAQPFPAQPFPAQPFPAQPFPAQPFPQATPPPAPPDGLEFHQLLRGGRPGWWWVGIPGVIGLLVAWILAQAVLIVPFLVGLMISGRSLDSSLDYLADLEHPTPIGLAYLNLGLASAIPLAFLTIWALHRLRPGWLTSVVARMRWGYFAACFGLAFLSLIATVVVGLLLPSEGSEQVTGDVAPFDDRALQFLLVVVLLTPFQAAGEEYLFRGYLTQAVGSLVPPGPRLRLLGRTLAVVIPAVLFALAHGIGQSPPVFFDRLAFGLVAGVLVIATGGLEAGIAMHVLNNFVAFGFAIVFGEMDTVLNPGGASWWLLPTTLTQSLVYLGLALLVARAMRLRRTADPTVLAASRPRV
jgi:membrane protease YdiL (CAAX protease family)